MRKFTFLFLFLALSSFVFSQTMVINNFEEPQDTNFWKYELSTNADPTLGFVNDTYSSSNSVSGNKNNLTIPANSLAFTYCQVPFVYSQSDENKITVYTKNNAQIELNKLVLDEDLSNSIFNRDGNIEKITVSFSK